MSKQKEKIIPVYYHPDALGDSPYEEYYLNPDEFLSFKSDLEVINTTKTGVLLSNKENIHLSVEAISSGIIRIQAAKESINESTTEKFGLINCQSGAAFKYQVDNSWFTFNIEDIYFCFDQKTKEFSFSDKSGNTLLQTAKGGIRFSDEKPEYSGQKSFCKFKLDDEKVFGFGGRILHPNRTGTTLDVFSEKAGVRTGDYGGCPIPFFISTKGYGFFLNNPWPHVYFDMGKTDKDEWFFQTPGGECDIFFIYGPEFNKIMNLYTGITGRIPMPEKWWLGFWCSSLSFTSSADVIKEAKRFREEKYPCDVIVLDGPWRGGPNFLKQYMEGGEYPSNDINWHPDFGDGSSMIKELEEIGFKTSLHLNSRNFSPETVKSGTEKGLFRNHERETVVKIGDKKAEEYYESLVTPRITEGTAIWWTDHADRVSGEICEGIPSRNLFGALWNRLLVNIMKKNGIKNSICLTRGSGIGGQKFGLPWPGDTRFGLEHLEEDIWYCMNAGLAGFSLTSADIGGFTLKYDPNDRSIYPTEQQKLDEVFEENNIIRRLCYSIFFIPVPRIHNNWCSVPKLPWNCPPSTRKLYKEFLEQRYRLIPYIYSCAIQSSITGAPILKPMVYYHRLDRNTYDIGDQFYMGDWLLIAPVTQTDAAARKVYLPEGLWTDMWTGKCYSGPSTIMIDTPIDKVNGLPVFIKAGAIITRQPLCEFLEDQLPSELTLDIYPYKNSEVKLYESPTITNTFTCESDEEKLTIMLENNAEMEREYIVKIHDISKLGKIFVNGELYTDEKIEYEDTTGILCLKCSIQGKSTIDIIVN